LGILLKWDDRCSGLWVWDAAGGAGGGRRAAFLVWPWGVGGVSVFCAGPAAVALLRVGWLNVRSPVLLDLYLRFCILDVLLMYFSCSSLCACVLPYMA